MKTYKLIKTHVCQDTRNSDKNSKSVLQTIEEGNGVIPMIVEKFNGRWYLHEIEVSEHECKAATAIPIDEPPLGPLPKKDKSKKK